MRRAIELIDKESEDPDIFETPVLGILTDSKPIETDGTIEYLKLPEKFSKRKRIYLLKIKGDSFKDVSIEDGDYIVIESKDKAEDGQLALISLENNNVTLKKITNHKDMKIHGLVIGVIRDYL